MANAGEDGTLELIREEPKLRLGCLELYVRLVDEGSGRDRFVVEEDVRQRVRVHWRSAAATGDAISWRVSCAFSPWESQVSISETLGREAVEWLWDGLNALILSVSQVSESALFGGGKSSLFGFCLQELCFRAVDRDRFRLGLSIWELRDTKAKDLLDPEEEAKQLRFDMVYFETPEQALSIWEAARSSASTRGGAAHVFVRVMLFDAQRPSMAALHFAEVAHSDDASIQADHKALQQLLQDAVAPPAASSSRLLEVLSPLVRGNCKSFLLCTVPERPAHGAEARRLLDLAEQASMITANCHRLEGKHHEDFHWAAQEDVLRKLRMSRSSQMSNSPSSTIQRPGKRSPADDAAGGRSSPVRSPVLEASVSAGPNELDRLLEEALTSSHPPPPRGTKDLVEEPRSPEAKALHAQDLQRPPPPQPLSPKENQAREQWLLQEYHELAGAVAALRAKNKAKAHRRQRTLAEAKEEVKSFTEGVQEVEDAVAAPLLLQALRQERITLKDEVALLRKANGYLSGLHGEEKRRAAQKIAAKQLQQEARRLPTARQALQKGEKRAALVQRCLEEVHARWDSAKAGKLQAEEEIQRLRPNFEELGRQVEAVDAERRWLQGELDKLRQASGGIRAKILHLREVRDAVDALPPEDSTASKTSLGRGCLERFATLQRRLATAAPQLMPLCTRARAGMEELLQSCDRLEERQRRLQQVAPLKDPSAPPRGPAGPVAPGRRKGTSRGSSMERPRDLQRSRSAELSIARSVRSSRPVRSPGESIYRQEEADEANPTPRSIRHCCISCGASFMADAHFCQHCGCKRYPNLAKVEDRPPIKGPAGTLQDLGLDGDPKAHERVRDTLDRDTPNSVSKISYGSKLWPSPAWRK